MAESIARPEIDPNFECDAPTYVDFGELASDDNADKWFGKKLPFMYVVVVSIHPA